MAYMENSLYEQDSDLPRIILIIPILCLFFIPTFKYFYST